MADDVVVGVRELKNNLSRYIGMAKRGESVIVTERGKPVIRLQLIVPASDAESEARERLLAAVAQGIADWNGERLRPTEPIIINRSGRMASDLLLEDRD